MITTWYAAEYFKSQLNSRFCDGFLWEDEIQDQTTETRSLNGRLLMAMSDAVCNIFSIQLVFHSEAWKEQHPIYVLIVSFNTRFTEQERTDPPPPSHNVTRFPRLWLFLIVTQARCPSLLTIRQRISRTSRRIYCVN